MYIRTQLLPDRLVFNRENRLHAQVSVVSVLLQTRGPVYNEGINYVTRKAALLRWIRLIYACHLRANPYPQQLVKSVSRVSCLLT